MKRKSRKSAIILLISILLIGLLAYSGLFGVNLGDYRIKTFGSNIDKGLDLVGGTSLLMEIKDENVDASVVDRTIDLIKLRIDPEGVKEVIVSKEGENRIRVEIPGEFDTDNVINTIGKTGELTFEDPDGNVVLTGKEVKKATPYMTQDNQYVVSLELNDEGATAFAEATEKFVGKSIAIKMDGEMLTNPTVQEAITGGKAQISGMANLEEASEKANIINSGALPVTLESASAQTVGPTIGSEALQLSKKAAIIGISLVILFMIIYYRIPGFIASVALVLYSCIVLIIFGQFGVVLSLSGIAGLLLTIGMAVDANVLIFERTKEELRLGKSIGTAVEAGYNRALSSILDSNITTIIAALVLYFLGSGAVKGFAVTLLVGIIVSIFTALFITKFLMKNAVNAGLISKASHFGIRGGKSVE
ncbi:MAG: protein translocase subunit SecD [Clostridium sp.]|nr:protein translocase subunit SecD [Clostridium sp.]